MRPWGDINMYFPPQIQIQIQIQIYIHITCKKMATDNLAWPSA